MKLKLPLLLLLFISIFANAQQTMSVKGSQPFPATQEYTFICEKYAFTGEASIQIAKTDKGGVLKITIATSNDKARIAGGLYVDLANADVIACTDKNVKESSEGKTTSYYYFTPAEFAKLKKNDVYAVRFIINGGSNTFGNETGYFTAHNKKNYFSTAYDKSKKSYDTAKEISVL
ncbi:hypothetical protein SAMN05444671_0476 [Flavobacterium sp. CF108]|uniref:hypothetical protein n=1 Tax=unclassified Flavobacterium TaxID=196869 RepID=UPI0008D20847|nr:MULTISPECIES: hypothetical protein [unclassified Flavobacterium]SEO27547.1 hypothetical protein SAMN04487978_2614 [Flavobacterium sp. fv08]SHG45378.1 hypothetical protein SAMN05444671_0476 [Flavobacterium sp. CF108]